jgi:hypothetical protein
VGNAEDSVNRRSANHNGGWLISHKRLELEGGGS